MYTYIYIYCIRRYVYTSTYVPLPQPSPPGPHGGGGVGGPRRCRPLPPGLSAGGPPTPAPRRAVQHGMLPGCWAKTAP